MKQLQRKDNEAYAILRNLRVSPSKANSVLEMIRGKKASEALNLLKFSSRGIAGEISKVLNSAIANAENNDKADIDLLFVKSVIVNQGMRLKRMKPRARGRADRIIKPTCHIEIILSDQEK